MDTANAFDNPLEEFVDQMFNFVHFADLKHFLEFSEEESFLDAVGEGPVLQQTF